MSKPTAAADRGFALVIVLWSIALITLVVTAITASGRSEVRMAAGLRSAAVARAAVDGAADEAIFRLAAGQWPRGAGTYTVQIGGTAVRVRVDDEAGMPNVNTIPLPMLAALLQAVGVAPAQVPSLAAAIHDYAMPGVDPSPGGAKAPQYAAAGLPYGPAGQRFRTVDEIGMVLGMTPEILARLVPHVSVAKAGNLKPDKADPVVRQAFVDAGPNGGYVASALRPMAVATLRITAQSLPPAAAARRRATIQLPGPDELGPAYALMSWE